MEQLFGSVESIVFSSEENGFVVARVKEPKKKELSLIVGTIPGLCIGESLSCTGVWRLHPKHGSQFEVFSFKATPPTDLLGIERYLSSGMIKGIGPKYAEKIVARFGIATLEIIETTPQRLLEVPGLGERRIEGILSKWKEQKEIRTVMIFLRGHEVSPSLAQKIFKVYGQKSIEVLTSHPYQVAQEVFGIGFKSADKIAQKLGMSKEAPERICSGIQHTLWELSEEGHVCFPEEELIAEAALLLEVEQERVGKELPLLERQKHIVSKEGLVWISPLFFSEQGIAKELFRLQISPCALRSVDGPKAVDWVETELHLRLGEEQKKAVLAMLNHKMLVLTGGPGTGKSTITKAIVKIYSKLTSRILLAAPTGRAAKRLSEIVRKKALTIHALLEVDPASGKFKRGKENPLKGDLLIIDEASMIDTQLMYSLLKAVESFCKVIFVGDVDQLPSVGPGSVLADLIGSQKIPTASLKEIFRQARGSDIIVNAHKVNQGQFPFLGGKRDFLFFEAETPQEVEQRLLSLFQGGLSPFHLVKEVQLLSPMKKGPLGTETLNRFLQGLLNPSSEPLMHMGRRFHIKDKVMQLRNNYQKEVFNGDIGYLSQIDLDEEKVGVLFEDKEVFYEFSELDELSLSYAVSVHKYQGSECPCLLFLIHTSHFKLLQRNLFYTAITRGKKKVIVIGAKKAIAIAIRTTDALKRHTGLQARIVQQFLANHIS